MCKRRFLDIDICTSQSSGCHRRNLVRLLLQWSPG